MKKEKNNSKILANDNEKILRKNNVGLAILFGSQISGNIHPNSDFDIGIVFEKEKKKPKPTDVYGDLYQVFSKAIDTENLDIIYLEDSPLSLQFRAINEGKVMYSSSPSFFADYKEKVILSYLDFKPVEEYFKSVFLGKILTK